MRTLGPPDALHSRAPAGESKCVLSWRRTYTKLWEAISYRWALSGEYETFHEAIEEAVTRMNQSAARSLRKRGIDPRQVVQVRGSRNRPKHPIIPLDQLPVSPVPDQFGSEPPKPKE